MVAQGESARAIQHHSVRAEPRTGEVAERRRHAHLGDSHDGVRGELAGGGPRAGGPQRGAEQQAAEQIQPESGVEILF